MSWSQRRLLFAPQHQANWIVSHAALPFALPIDNELFRVYFSSRDEQGRSQIGSFELYPGGSKDVFNLTPTPLITYGALGLFDDRGTTMSCIVQHQGDYYLYYTGWALGVTVPFYFYIGLAVSTDGGQSFQKVSQCPIVDRSEVDPFLTASPYVLIEGDRWRMWYVSCSKWVLESDKPKHYYHIRYAESVDGIHWHREGKVCVDFASSDEYAFSRPSIIKDSSGYRMWYAYRGSHYKIGYAESSDGIIWRRQDSLMGLDVSTDGWDSEMVAYPFVFEQQGILHLLYNGNGYGQTGIGCAVWQS